MNWTSKRGYHRRWTFTATGYYSRTIPPSPIWEYAILDNLKATEIGEQRRGKIEWRSIGDLPNKWSHSIDHVYRSQVFVIGSVSVSHSAFFPRFSSTRFTQEFGARLLKPRPLFARCPIWLWVKNQTLVCNTHPLSLRTYGRRLRLRIFLRTFNNDDLACVWSMVVTHVNLPR